MPYPTLATLPLLEGTALILMLVLGGVVGFALLVMWVMYNRLVSLRNHCRESFSNIDTELQRRHDLIPNLVAIVKGYAAHEKELFEKVTELRSRAVSELSRIKSAGLSGSESLGGLERDIGDAMGQILVVAEGYPDLKASSNFRQLMREVSMTEDRIQAARRFHNGNVRDFNNACETFPSSIVANRFAFTPAAFFNTENALARIPPSLKELA